MLEKQVRLFALVFIQIGINFFVNKVKTRADLNNWPDSKDFTSLSIWKEMIMNEQGVKKKVY